MERSLEPSFRVEKILIAPRLEWPDAFVEVTVGGEGEPQASVRIQASRVSVVYLSPSGLEKVLASSATLQCREFSIGVSAKELSVQCGDSGSDSGSGSGSDSAGLSPTALTTAIAEPAQHRVAVATNLTRVDLQALKVVGRSGELPVEEAL
jgi:hypothetical protein